MTWRPAKLGTHAGAEQVEAKRIIGGVAYRYTPGGRTWYAGTGAVTFDEDTRGLPKLEGHPARWWYRLAERIMPQRCREIPEARAPWRTLLRQVAIVRRWVYLQGFASGESRRWYHAHGRKLLVIGLRGSYTEHRPGRPSVRRSAPYAHTMGVHELHRVSAPSEDHCSIAVFFTRGERYYVSANGRERRRWQEHTIARVARV